MEEHKKEKHTVEVKYTGVSYSLQYNNMTFFRDKWVKRNLTLDEIKELLHHSNFEIKNTEFTDTQEKIITSTRITTRKYAIIDGQLNLIKKNKPLKKNKNDKKVKEVEINAK